MSPQPETELETTIADLSGSSAFTKELNDLIEGATTSEGEGGAGVAAGAGDGAAGDPDKDKGKTGGEGKAGETAGEGEGKGKAEGSGEGTPKPETTNEPPAPVIPDEMRELFPEVTNLRDLAPKLKEVASELKDLRDSDTELSKMFEDHPFLLRTMKALKKGVSDLDAVRTALELEGGEEIPDPTKDPKKFEAYTRRKVEREQAAKNLAAEETKQQQHAEKVKVAARKQMTDLYAENKTPDDEQKRFERFIGTMFYGDELTGMPMRDFAKAMWKAFRYDEDVKSARDAGIKDGKNSKIEDIVNKDKLRTGDGLPNLGAGGGASVEGEDEFTAIERSITRNESIFK